MCPQYIVTFHTKEEECMINITIITSDCKSAAIRNKGNHSCLIMITHTQREKNVQFCELKIYNNCTVCKAIK